MFFDGTVNLVHMLVMKIIDMTQALLYYAADPEISVCYFTDVLIVLF